LIGLVVASFVLGNTCWTGTVKMLALMDTDIKEIILEQVGLHLRKMFRQELTDWICKYWKCIEQQHLQLLKYLQTNTKVVNAIDILLLSLIVIVPEPSIFAPFADHLVVTEAAQSIVANITERPK
jgi:hypothetical protein